MTRHSAAAHLSYELHVRLVAGVEMSMMQYAVFDDVTSAEAAIRSIDQEKGFQGTWAQPHAHPTDHRCLVPVDWAQLQGCEAYIGDREIINIVEAKRRGWEFGAFTGPLARERRKLEDMYFLLDAVVGMYGSPNFPALRSLTLSFLSAAYALRESLKSKAESPLYRNNLEHWWRQREAELDDRRGLLKSLEVFMHTEKHGGKQHSPIDLVPNSFMVSLVVDRMPLNGDPSTLTISAEGAFAVVGVNTPGERRVPVGIHEAKYEITLQSAPQQHLGQSIAGASFLQSLSMVMQYYALLVFNARQLVGDLPSSGPVVHFEGSAHLKAGPSD
jgi:hypothetical protein